MKQNIMQHILVCIIAVITIMVAVCLVSVTAKADTSVSSVTGLKDAIAAAPTDGTSTTITLTGDIDCATVTSGSSIFYVNNRQNIILDLNGHSISAVDGTAGTFYVIDNAGKLTVKDGVGTGAVTVSNSKDWSTYTTTSAIRNRSGSLTIDGGFFSSTSTLEKGVNMCYAVDNLGDIYGGMKQSDGRYHSTCVINGGKFASDYDVIRNYSTGDLCDVSLTTNGGTFVSNRGIVFIYLQNNWDDENYRGSGGDINVVINKGIFDTGIDKAAKLVYSSAYYTGNKPFEMVINGGTFSADIPIIVDYYGDDEGLPDEGSITVNGGSFNAPGYTDGYSTAVFTDFTFTEKISRDFGYVTVKDEKGENTGTKIIELVRSKPVISFDTNGGTSVERVTVDGKINLADYKTAKPGYDFVGWFTDEACTQKANFTALSNDIRLYAKWTKSLLLAKVKPRESSQLKLDWTKVTGASRYVIYGNVCNHDGRKYRLKKMRTVSAAYNVTIFKGLKKYTAYKFRVEAYRGAKMIGKSCTIHNYTTKKMGGRDSIKTISGVKKTLTIKIGRTAKMKAGIVTYYGRTPIDTSHAKKLRFLSTDNNIVKVKSGKLIGMKKGTCRVYTMLINGSWAHTDVTVR